MMQTSSNMRQIQTLRYSSSKTTVLLFSLGQLNFDSVKFKSSLIMKKVQFSNKRKTTVLLFSLSWFNVQFNNNYVKLISYETHLIQLKSSLTKDNSVIILLQLSQIIQFWYNFLSSYFKPIKHSFFDQ